MDGVYDMFSTRLGFAISLFVVYLFSYEIPNLFLIGGLFYSFAAAFSRGGWRICLSGWSAGVAVCFCFWWKRCIFKEMVEGKLGFMVDMNDCG